MSLHSSRSHRCDRWQAAAQSFMVWLVVLTLTGCHAVVLVGREQSLLVPERTEIELGAKAYAEILQTELKSQNAHLKIMVERVGRRIAAVSERPDFQWEFTLLAGPAQNAFCLPGGKVGIYEGLLPICQNEAGLAAVMSHEIAHAIARHGGERMSHQESTEGSPWTPNRLWRNNSDSERLAMIKSAYGISSKDGVQLPFSRTQETEADSIGMNLMARAGYDPEEAPRFWSRFNQSASPKLPELLATHPSDHHRATELKNLVPRAMAVYQGVTQRRGLGEQIPMQPLLALTPKAPTNSTPAAAPTTTALVAPPTAALMTAVLEAPPATTTTAATPAVPPTESQTPSAAVPSITAVSIAPAPIVFTGPAPPAQPALEGPADLIAPTTIQPASAEAASADNSVVSFPEADSTAPRAMPKDDWTPHIAP